MNVIVFNISSEKAVYVLNRLENMIYTIPDTQITGDMRAGVSSISSGISAKNPTNVVAGIPWFCGKKLVTADDTKRSSKSIYPSPVMNPFFLCFTMNFVRKISSPTPIIAKHGYIASEEEKLFAINNINPNKIVATEAA